MGLNCCDPLARRAVEQNLQDAGCSAADVEHMLQLMEEGKTTELLQALKCQRCRLIEELHKKRQKVDCLDYLIYQLKKCACPGKSKCQDSAVEEKQG